jgi:predicted AlkP superfamily phosphohydrolase/phosphomutase
VIVVGIDGAERDVIEPMIEAGELPNFRRFIEEAAFGHLINPGPQVSPLVWTTFATNHFGRGHGILDFVYPLSDVDRKQPVDSTLRREPAP